MSTQQESSEPDLVTESVPPSKEGSVPPAEPEANRETEQANMQPAAKEDAKLNPPNGQEMGILDGTESLERNLVEADSASLQSEGSSELTHQGGDVTTSAQEHTAQHRMTLRTPPQLRMEYLPQRTPLTQRVHRGRRRSLIPSLNQSPSRLPTQRVL